MERAWAVHLPEVKLQDAIQRLELGGGDQASNQSPVTLTEAPELSYRPVGHEQPTGSSPAEFSNAEDYEFDESQDFDNSTDGMGSLVMEPGKVGYTGPQSGVAALKFLQTLHLYIPIHGRMPFSLDEPDSRSIPEASPADIARYINDHFAIYHTAYPLLHEGTFRARVSGKTSYGTYRTGD